MFITFIILYKSGTVNTTDLREPLRTFEPIDQPSTLNQRETRLSILALEISGFVNQDMTIISLYFGADSSASFLIHKNRKLF